ncbi:hypothetical protein Y032_0132g1731 [Ancylostoma ceylanicum]|uniref:Uncharacterized protein n=1 Tax=Ancylostoma ceylanicum TaxID=53326 RepID=A0A016T6I7_9BILA|nr:hypothetical protein Y032_0132g1731 [Ancylostoma ceylanicum]
MEATRYTNKKTSGIYHGCLDVIDSYRVLFINGTILFNCFLWSRRQKKVFIETKSNHGDQYFSQLQSSWKMTR